MKVAVKTITQELRMPAFNRLGKLWKTKTYALVKGRSTFTNETNDQVTSHSDFTAVCIHLDNCYYANELITQQPHFKHLAQKMPTSLKQDFTQFHKCCPSELLHMAA